MEWLAAAGGKRARFGSVLVMLAAGTMAYAGPTYDFTCITNDSAADPATGEAQLLVEVLDPGSRQVEFLFTNAGPNAGSITDIYFDDGALLGIAGISNGPGGSFDRPATPSDLPGGSNASPPFVTTDMFSADSEPPAQPSGVNPGEWVTIRFNLGTGRTCADALGDLASGAVRIALHVQGFSGGDSESFVNNPSAIPTPGAVLLTALGLGSVGWLRQRRLLGR